MKRILCMLVLICLMPFASPAKGEGIYYTAEQYIQGLWEADGDIYVLDGQRIVRLTAEGGEVQTELQARYSAGACDGENLWCVRFDSEAEALLMERIAENGGAVQTLSFDAWDMGDLAVRCMLATEYGFCLITQDGELIICRREDDEAVLVEEDEDGYALSPLVMTMWGGESALLTGEDGSEIRFYILDLETCGVRRGPAISCMDAKSFGCLITAGEQITYVLDSQLWQMEGLDGQPQPLRDANPNVYFGSWGLLAEDGVLLAGVDKAETLNFGETAGKNVLKVASNLVYFVEQVAQEMARDGISVEVSSRSMGYGEISKAILTESDAYDVYVISMSYPDYDALYRKGYLQPLEDEEIALWTAGVYPEMAKAFTVDGVPVALPLSMYAVGMACNTQALQELGIQEIPATWKDFFRLLAQLSQTGTGDYFAFSPLCLDLKDLIFYDFYQYALLEAQQLDDPRGFFDTPEMRETLAEFERIDFDAFAQGWEEDCAEDEVLFISQASLDCEFFHVYNTEDYGLEVMPLSILEGQPALIEGRMTVAIINPYGQNQQDALMLLRALLADMPLTEQANMQAGWTEPIVDPVQEEGKDIKYLVSSQGLACYQGYAGNVRIWHDSGLGFDGEEMLSDLRSRYLAGNMTGPEFLQALDEKWSMMLLERE